MCIYLSNQILYDNDMVKKEVKLLKKSIYVSILCHPLANQIWLAADEEKLMGIFFEEVDLVRFLKGYNLISKEDHHILTMAKKELTAYFNGELMEFTTPLHIKGTPFQLSVWEAMMEIPYGETRTYSEIAAQINRPLAVRAVGQASRANKFPFIIPCHRIIGKSGSLTGYAGNKTSIKSRLLQLEGAL